MKSQLTTRRAVLVGAAAAIPAIVLPTLGHAAEADQPLLRLWAEYLDHVHAHAAALAAYLPVREAFDAKMPLCPPDVLPGDHWESVQPLWRSYGLDPLYDAWGEKDSNASAAVAAILATPAESLTGIGIKLAAMPVGLVSEEDMADAIASVLQDIARLTGIDFAASSTTVAPTDVKLVDETARQVSR
jgi:hypothetical protein